MGCAEGKLVGLMKRRGHIEELIGVDIDPQLLRRQESNIQPLTTDFLLLRERPLHITLMQGSPATPKIMPLSTKINKLSNFIDFHRFYC